MPPTKCSIPANDDRYWIEMETILRVVFRYYNHEAKCSDTIEGTIMGRGEPWEFTLEVIVGNGPLDDSEVIHITPHNPNYVATPGYVVIPDGMEKIIIIEAIGY